MKKKKFQVRQKLQNNEAVVDAYKDEILEEIKKAYKERPPTQHNELSKSFLGNLP